MLHRDLKPENVMVREDGVLKLMDFGIAKILDRDEKMTMTGALVGSPAHMAPEIIEGEEAGAEADVFSLGTMLYLFATGAAALRGAQHHRHIEADPRRRATTTPGRWCRRCPTSWRRSSPPASSASRRPATPTRASSATRWRA